MSQKENKKDPLEPLKLIAYARAFTPLGREDVSYQDLLIYAQMMLCKETKTLYKDPIWDTYTDEEILIEYFSHFFMKDEDAKSEFEAAVTGVADDMFEWLDQKSKEADKELEDSLEDSVSFTPAT